MRTIAPGGAIVRFLSVLNPTEFASKLTKNKTNKNNKIKYYTNIK